MPEAFDLQGSALPLDPEIREFLQRHPDAQPRAYRDGEVLVREGEESREIFVLLDGALVVERESEARGAPPVILACLSAEEGVAIVGEMAYLGALRRTATVRSSGYTRVLRLEPRHVDAILEGFPMLTRVICRQFSRRLQETLASLTRLQARFVLNPTRRMASDGDVLFEPGAPARELHQLLAGAVRMERGGVTETVTPEAMPQGFLDLDDYLAARPRGARAIVEGMAFVAVIGEEDREAVVRCFPGDVLERFRGR